MEWRWRQLDKACRSVGLFFTRTNDGSDRGEKGRRRWRASATATGDASDRGEETISRATARVAEASVRCCVVAHHWLRCGLRKKGGRRVRLAGQGTLGPGVWRWGGHIWAVCSEGTIRWLYTRSNPAVRSRSDDCRSPKRDLDTILKTSKFFSRKIQCGYSQRPPISSAVKRVIYLCLKNEASALSCSSKQR